MRAWVRSACVLAPDVAAHLDIVGCSHIVLGRGACLADNELAFSDRYFGSNNEAIPLLLCGESLAAALGSAGLAGIDSCEPVTS